MTQDEPVTVLATSHPSRPGAALQARLSGALYGLRSRALRRLELPELGPVLDLGCGRGGVTTELRRRCRGPVVALDLDTRMAREAGVPAVRADAAALPFADDSFALVFAQLAFLWIEELEAAVAELSRVLAPGGLLVAIEPDYPGMIESPALGLRELWLGALERADARAGAGRALHAALIDAGARVQVDLLTGPAGEIENGLALLEELPLTEAEEARLGEIWDHPAIVSEQALVHLPFLALSAHFA